MQFVWGGQQGIDATTVVSGFVGSRFGGKAIHVHHFASSWMAIPSAGFKLCSEAQRDDDRSIRE